MNNKELYLISIDLNNMCDRMSREILWKSIKKKGVMIVYIQVTQDMYKRISTRVLCAVTWWRDERLFHYNRITPRFNSEILYFYFNFGCIPEVHQRVSTEMYAFFYRFYNPT